jgi:Haloacid dehalogenase-like hydrolase
MVTESRLFPGAGELLRELGVRGVKIGVITGKERLRTVAIMQHLGISRVVQALVCCDDETPPGGGWRLLSDLGVCRNPGAASAGWGCSCRSCGWAGSWGESCRVLVGSREPEVPAGHDPWQTVTTIEELAALLRD